jgi:dipeptidase E
MIQLLLFSNSTNSGEKYLEYTFPYIDTFLKNARRHALFIPYAGISLGYDTYSELVQKTLSELSVGIQSIHTFADKKQAVHKAELIIVGGGNTFHLLKFLQDEDLLDEIRKRARNGMPYIGWSAGSNLACPTICTTNDMPIVQPSNFNALNLIPFQINPHYTDFYPLDHAGETREMRIQEFLLVNRHLYAIGLREGTLLHINGNTIKLLGKKSCRVFKYGLEPFEIDPGENLDFLMQ